MRSILTLSCALFISAHTSNVMAGTAYTVRMAGGPFTTQQREFVVVADSGRIRATAAEKGPDTVVVYDGILSIEGAPMIALNSENATWYELESASPFALSSHYLAPLQNATVQKLKLDVDEVGVDVAGEHRYSGRLTYEVHAMLSGEKVKVTCSASFDVTTTETRERRDWLGRMLPQTGYPTVDKKFSEAEEAIRGFPTRLSLTVKRTYAGGTAMTDSSSIHVADLREVTALASSFDRPTGYRWQRPVIGASGQ